MENGKPYPRRIEIGLFALVFLAHGYFVGTRGWNQSAHLASILAFVEPGTPATGTFHIDGFVGDGGQGGITQDWAWSGGHYYSNKAPGLPMLGVPVYAAISYAQRAVSLDPMSATLSKVNVVILNLALSVLAGAIATVTIFRIGLRVRGSSCLGALAVALVYGFGTLVLPYDSSLWSHSPAATLLVLALAFIFGTKRWSPVVAGFFAGMAILVEYQAAAPVLGLIACMALSRLGRHQLIAFSAGATPPILILAFYQKICFGGFLVAASALSNPAFFYQPSKLAGQFGLPSPKVLVDMLVSWRYGLFVFMPILLFALPDAWRMLRMRLRDHRAFLWLPVVATIAMLSCFIAPDGGWATGPRYLIIALPFLCLALPDPTTLSRRAAMLFIVFAVVSAVNMVAIVSVDVLSPSEWTNPLYDEIYPAFLNGHSRTGTDFGRIAFSLPLRASVALWCTAVMVGAAALAKLCEDP